ncbi:MAG: glycosyltransferase [Rhodobacteraceae bacterium]|nr:glycosyltransferase [Paracoccaceae bacterium]
MIPKIIHQTWKNHDLPVPRDLPESWQTLNPGWEYRFWTDEDLHAFVENEYPDMWPLYQIVEKPVQKADIARYLIMHKFGGVYADIDTRCVGKLDILEDENRIIISEEPLEHWPDNSIRHRGLGTMLFNGTFASPAGHPFWLHVMDVLIRCQHAKKDVLESTGPIMLTGAYLSYENPDQIAVHSCHLFDPETSFDGLSKAEEFGDYAPARISIHLWACTWLKRPGLQWKRPIRYVVFGAVYYLTRGKFLTKDAAAKQIDQPLLLSDLPPEGTLPMISILIPVRNSTPHLEQCFALINRLDYPKDRIKISFCEGDSTDGTVEMLNELIEKYQGDYRTIQVTTFQTNLKIDRKTRWFRAIQKKRRTALAKVRNHLLRFGLDDSDDYALWIDADVCDYPADILTTLLAEREKIVTPDCVRVQDGPSYDLNAFVDFGPDKFVTDYYSRAYGGIFQPSIKFSWRRVLHELRYLDRVPLTSVGGTMLLVHASVHRAGIDFPEIPYCDLLETEGFGKMAHDFGVSPIGLPNVHIMHVLD